MTAAPHGSTTAHGAVIPTNAARIPLRTIPKSQYFENTFPIHKAVTAPNPEEINVLVATFAAKSPYPPVTTNVEPGLKPNHPNLYMTLLTFWKKVTLP